MNTKHSWQNGTGWCEIAVVSFPSSLVGFWGFHPYMRLFLWLSTQDRKEVSTLTARCIVCVLYLELPSDKPVPNSKYALISEMSLSMVLMHTFPVLWYILDRLCWNTLYENNTDKLSIEKEVSGRKEHTHVITGQWKIMFEIIPKLN